MNVAYLGWCPTQTAHTAYSIVHIHRPDRKGTLASDPKGARAPPPFVHATDLHTKDLTRLCKSHSSDYTNRGAFISFREAFIRKC